MHVFESMGCEVVVGGASGGEAAAVEALFRERDRVFSRFDGASELSRVNARAGRALLVSPRFAEHVELALAAAAATGGLVDPTLGAAVEAAGYTRDFALLAPDPRPAGPTAPGCWRSVRLVGRLLTVHAGVRLDLNGVVKARAVDDALALLVGDGFVSAGGDLATRGGVEVAVPGGGAVRLVAGGLATSGTARRRWLRGGVVQHHLIDPATGRPASSPWREITVCGADCLAADVAAKAAFLAGERALGWLDARNLPGRAVDERGEAAENEAWRRLVASAPPRLVAA